MRKELKELVREEVRLAEEERRSFRGKLRTKVKEYEEKIISLEGRVKDLERGKKVGMAGEEISEKGSEKEGARSIYSGRSRAVDQERTVVLV